MSRFKTVILYVFIVLIVGCNAKKKYINTESKVIDSVIVKTETIKAPLLTDVMYLPEICKDSIAKEFKRIIVRDTDTIEVEVKDNGLLVSVRQQEKTISELEQKLSIRESEIEQLKKTTKYKIHWGLVLGSFLAGGVLFSYAYYRFFG